MLPVYCSHALVDSVCVESKSPYMSSSEHLVRFSGQKCNTPTPHTGTDATTLDSHLHFLVAFEQLCHTKESIRGYLCCEVCMLIQLTTTVAMPRPLNTALRHWHAHLQD
ncbi:hypothetical protein E2C01_093260 [Portunus trituberculatus]|uniref:Uncharacterized protein n=1 Tax=Portunus trituberculatus TaxID=210409 RepID=A0A5B7JUB7_PORTR|nr:hypothetical protein [Portunus trituberculatus]